MVAFLIDCFAIISLSSVSEFNLVAKSPYPFHSTLETTFEPKWPWVVKIVFAVYEKGPGIDHAPYLIQVYNRNESITSTGIVLAGRLASTVRKQFILAIPKGKDKIDFLALDWWKA